MSKIFLIPGLGADTRIYNNIEFSDEHDVIPVDWIEPDKLDTLNTYAQKIIYQYFITDNRVILMLTSGENHLNHLRESEIKI